MGVLTRSHMLQPQTSTCLGKQPLLLTSSTRINIPNRHSGPRKVYILFSRRQQIQCYTNCSFNTTILFCVCIFRQPFNHSNPRSTKSSEIRAFLFFFLGGKGSIIYSYSHFRNAFSLNVPHLFISFPMQPVGQFHLINSTFPWSSSYLETSMITVPMTDPWDEPVNLGKRPLWYVPVLPPLYRCTLSINSMVFAVSHVSNSVSPLLDM